MVGEEFLTIPERSREVAERKKKVLEMLAHGWSIKEMALEFHVSESTIKRDIGQLLNQVGARNSSHLVMLAYEKGLLGEKKEEKEKEEDAGSKEG